MPPSSNSTLQSERMSPISRTNLSICTARQSDEAFPTRDPEVRKTCWPQLGIVSNRFEPSTETEHTVVQPQRHKGEDGPPHCDNLGVEVLSL